MSATPLQLFAVSALIGECQALAASAILNPSQQAALRCLIQHTRSAFEMPATTASPGEAFTANSKPRGSSQLPPRL